MLILQQVQWIFHWHLRARAVRDTESLLIYLLLGANRVYQYLLFPQLKRWLGTGFLSICHHTLVPSEQQFCMVYFSVTRS